MVWYLLFILWQYYLNLIQTLQDFRETLWCSKISVDQSDGNLALGWQLCKWRREMPLQCTHILMCGTLLLNLLCFVVGFILHRDYFDGNTWNSSQALCWWFEVWFCSNLRQQLLCSGNHFILCIKLNALSFYFYAHRAIQLPNYGTPYWIMALTIVISAI